MVDRRVFIVGSVAGGLTAAGCDGNVAKAVTSMSNEARAPAGPAQPMAPLLGRYRADQPRLFLAPPREGIVSISGGRSETPAHAAVAPPKSAYSYGGVGPTTKYVDVGSEWAWKNRNGDWIDAKGMAQGAAPHWACTTSAQAVGVREYVVDATAGAKAAQEPWRWNAYIVRCMAGACGLSTAYHATAPFMTVQYVDGSTARLACVAAAAFEPSSSYAQGGAPQINMRKGRHAAYEFERPDRAVRSATLSLTVLEHGKDIGQIHGFLANPPLNTEAVASGLAAGHPRDDGIRAERAVIFAHQYADGSREADWIEQKNLNVYNPAFWSPHVFDPNARKDEDKLPFIHQGRWVKTKANASLVDSRYSGEGFKPLAPGLGAIRVKTPGNRSSDGASVGYDGGLGTDLAMYLPDAQCGYLDEIYIRYYLRLGMHPAEYLAQTKMFRTAPTAAAQYALQGGKFGIGASHWTRFGGNNNIGGGNIGWTNRNLWREYPADVECGGTRIGVHSWDMLGHDRQYGEIGGLGAAIYPGHWYCLESRLKLNTVDTSRSPFQADPAKNLDDAEFDMWLDGRKVLEMRNFSYRKLPLDYGGPSSWDRKTRMGKTPFEDKRYLVPFRQLGVTAITLNDYNGGVLPAGTDRFKFYAGLVVATAPIGPMAGL